MPIPRKPSLEYSSITDTDSYKLSHWTQYPPGFQGMMSYFESRGGRFKECTLFGLQYLLHEYLSRRVTRQQVEDAAAFAKAHGEPFNYNGWMHIVINHGGRLPVRIRAIPEGLVVPTGNAILTIESTDERVPWVVSWLETMLVRLWAPSTVAIASRESKRIIRHYLDISADDPDSEINFKLHSFAARGVTCLEQSRLNEAGHLLTFLGSDTIEGIRLLNHFYDADMAGNSIPATEHSTVTMWGREHEYEMFQDYVQRELVDRQLPPGVPKLAACVSDSWDIYEACRAWTSDPLLSMIKGSGGTLVIRPDSGDPLVVLPKMLDILAARLGSEMRINSQGFCVLPDYFRIIQGDGINQDSMAAILKRLVDLNWSTSNIAFGSGGGLLQQWNRDTQKWAFKCCAAKIGGTWRDVYKDPVTDPGKKSKRGRLDLIQHLDGGYQTVWIPDGEVQSNGSVLELVFENGEIMRHTTLYECRERMAL